MRQDRIPAERLAAERPAPEPQGRAEPVLVADRPSRAALVWLLAPVTLVLSAAALKLSAVVTLPLAFSYFLAVLVQPLQLWLRRKLPPRLRWLAVPLTMLTIVATIGLAITVLSLSLGPVISRGPDYAQRFQDWFHATLGWARGHGVELPEPAELGNSSLGTLASVLPTGLEMVGGLLGAAVLVFFFTLLMLLEADVWRRKAEAALGRSGQMRETVDTIGHKVRWYLLVRSFSGALSGALVGLWLWLIGVDFALLWGIMFFLFNYAPTVGSIVAGVLATLVALMQLGFVWAVVAAAGMLAIDQAIGNFLDPNLQGRTLDISPLVVLVAVIFWGWIWGVPGMLLAVPMTAAMITVCEQVPALRPIALLMIGGEERG